MSQSVTLLPKSMITTSWQFGEELAGFIPEGVYRISYQRKTTPPAGQESSGQVVYLTRKGTNSNVRAMTGTGDIWYVRKYNGLMYILLCFTEVDTAGNVLHNSLGMPYADGNGALQDMTGMFPARLVLAQTELGGMIYHPETGTKYIPIQLGASSDTNYVIPASGVSLEGIGAEDLYGWRFEPYNCQLGTELVPPKTFMLHWANNWLQAKSTESGLQLVTTNIPPQSGNFKQYLWTYADNKLFDCENRAINYNPAAPLSKIGTGESEIPFGQTISCSALPAASSVALYNGVSSDTVVVMLDNATMSALNVVTVNGIYIPISMACARNISKGIDSGVEWTVIYVDVSKPASIPTGVYQLKQGKQCIGQDGKLSENCGDASYWSYDGVSKLQNSKSGQCLINSSTGLCNLQNLTVGSCEDPNTNRFVMGVDNSLYDPQTGLCYSALAPETYMYDLTFRENFDYKKPKDWLIPVIFAVVILIILFLAKRR